MRNPLTLAWWILILGVLEISTLALDRSHHLAWGRGGLMLLKAAYLAFAAVLLVRFLSFRSRKNFETMVDSYNKISGQAWSAQQAAGEERRKFLFYMGLVVVASGNFITPVAWGDLTFRTAILLDLVFWLMALRWVVRAHWLKALGRKEKLKEGLDDARSRLKSQPPEAPAPAPQARRWPFLTLFIVAILATSAISLYRWMTSEQVYRISELKGCLLSCLDQALASFHRDGRMDDGLAKAGCLSRHREDVDIGMGFQRGELLLWSIEKPGKDYFGNGRDGDQGLMLDAEGRFRTSGGK